MISETFLISQEKNDGAQLLVFDAYEEILVGWLLSMTFFAYCLLACLFLNIDEIEQLQKKKLVK